MKANETQELPQWYMYKHWNDSYENIHEGPNRTGNEFAVPPGQNPITSGMLERALHQADLLPDARDIASAVNTGLPELQFVNTVLRFGHELVGYDAYTPGNPKPWPERADEITLYAKMKYRDGITEEKSYPLDIALAPVEEQPAEPPLAILSKNATINVEEMTTLLARVYGNLDLDVDQDVNEVHDRARTMATIACLGMSGRLTAIERLAKSYIIDVMPRVAVPTEPITLTLFGNGAPEAEAAENGARGDRGTAKARNRRNLHHYEGTSFRNHPGIEHGLRLDTGSDEAGAVLSIPEGVLLQELGTAVNGLLVKLDPSDRCVPVWATHGVVWRTHQGDKSPTAVHLLDEDDVTKLTASSTSETVRRIVNAAEEKMLASMSSTTTDDDIKKLDSTIDAGTHHLSRLNAHKPR